MIIMFKRLFYIIKQFLFNYKIYKNFEDILIENAVIICKQNQEIKQLKNDIEYYSRYCINKYYYTENIRGIIREIDQYLNYKYEYIPTIIISKSSNISNYWNNENPVKPWIDIERKSVFELIQEKLLEIKSITYNL